MAGKTRVNREITSPTVRLVGPDGVQLGIVSLSDALRQAGELGLDLAEIAPNADPPVARILDWGKFRYEQTKQEQKARRNQKQVEVKEVRVGLKIGDHDLEVKLKRARKFLEEGHKVKVSLRFRGREITHPDLGFAMMERVKDRLSDIAVQEQPPALAGRSIDMILGMKKDAKT